ncbi:hypothetical protein B0H10DRAFT_2445649, partial [Mycena sp. CBHHK59/15]
MVFNLIYWFWFFLFARHVQDVVALTFDPVVGPILAGTELTLQWTLDGSEPAQGWDIWFFASGSGVRLVSVAAPSTSVVVTFPGSGNGTFEALSGTQVLATSNEVDLALSTPAGNDSPTLTFSATVISRPSFAATGVASIASTSLRSTTSASAASAASRPAGFNTGALLG